MTNMQAKFESLYRPVIKVTDVQVSKGSDSPLGSNLFPIFGILIFATFTGFLIYKYQKEREEN